MAGKVSDNQINRRGEPLHLYMQRSINVGMAVKVINETLAGMDVKPQRLNTALAVYNKTVPNYMAMAIEVEHKVTNNILDLQAQALEAGLDPATLLPEKTSEPAQSQLDPPTPPSEPRD